MALTLGMNYNYYQGIFNPPVDFALLKALGVNTIRSLISDYVLGSPSFTRTQTLAALSAGMYVIHGVGSGSTTLTASNKNTFYTAVQNEATWCQAQANPNLEFCVGSEEEYHIDGSLTQAQVRTDMRAQAATCKGIYTYGKISYSTAQGQMNAWHSDGTIGSLDRLNFDLYGNGTNFYTDVDNMVSWFGGNSWITEFGPDSGGYGGSWTPDSYAIKFKNMLNKIKNSTVPRALIYNFMDGSNKYGCLSSTNGQQRVWFMPLMGNRRTVTNYDTP